MSARLKPSPKIDVGSPEHRQVELTAAVYSYLLRNCLPLFESDARQVERDYGIPPETQYLLGYRSAPEPVRAFSETLDDSLSRWLDTLDDDAFLDWFTFSKQPLYSYTRTDAPATEFNLALNLIERGITERFGEVAGIPGLYVDEGLHIKMPRRGLIVPCRIDSIVRALLVYPNAGEDKTFWLSSKDLNLGAPAKTTLHIANQHVARRSHVCLLVRHAIEADSLAWESGECVVATNGMSPLRLVWELRLALPDLKGCVASPVLGDSVVRTLRENRLRVRVMGVEGEANV